jgi:hypothetical protein
MRMVTKVTRPTEAASKITFKRNPETPAGRVYRLGFLWSQGLESGRLDQGLRRIVTKLYRTAKIKEPP